jgi:hypothetical protein
MTYNNYKPSMWSSFLILVISLIFFGSIAFALQSFFNANVSSDDAFDNLIMAALISMFWMGVTQGYRTHKLTRSITVFSILISFIAIFYIN